MAAFRQATSREDDPQLHTHVVISAKVQTADGRWLALDARYLKRKQRALGGLYQSVLRAELTHRYGVAWGPIVNGQAEIAGMPARAARRVLEAHRPGRRRSSPTRSTSSATGRAATRPGGSAPRSPARPPRTPVPTKTHAADRRPRRPVGATRPPRSAGPPRPPRRGTCAPRPDARRPATPSTVARRPRARSRPTARPGRAPTCSQAICDLAPPVSQLVGTATGPQRVEHGLRPGHRRLRRPSTRQTRAARCARPTAGRSGSRPIEPHLTHERVLAQEERILAVRHRRPRRTAGPSTTVDRDGLDVLQADAAAAVAGHDRLVLVVGPAGTGKTTALRRAADDLHRQRPAGVRRRADRQGRQGPARRDRHAGRHRRQAPPRVAHRPARATTTGCPPGTTLVVDEAGMVGTGSARPTSSRLAVSQQWRLVLVGDPRQLQAVGRGGMFDELCRTGRTHELATIHRFRHRWEQAASLQLRAGNPDALDAYFDHGRVTAGTFDDLVADIARQWIEHTAAGRTRRRRRRDQRTRRRAQRRDPAAPPRSSATSAPRAVRVAGGETAAVGDVVVTRRNDRTLRTDRGEPVRNRDRWTVVDVAPRTAASPCPTSTDTDR